MSPSTKKRVLILGAHGWPVRNFLCNPGFQTFLNDHDCHFWSPAWQSLSTHPELAGKATFAELEPVIPGRFKERLFWLSRVLYAKRSDQKNIRNQADRVRAFNDNRRLNRFFLGFTEKLASALGGLVPSAWVKHIQRWCGTAGAAVMKTYECRLRELAPDLVFSTCPQINFFEWPPVIIAKRLGIPLVAQINGWDNPTTKGYLAVDFDRYFVWSAPMEEQLSRYLGLPPDTIVHTGPPSFDFYFQPIFQETRQAFAARYQLDPGRPIILYGGVTVGLMPGDPAVCAVIADAIRQGRLPAGCQILIRLHPTDPGHRWRALLEQYPELRIAIPNPNKNTIEWTPGLTTVRDQVSCVRHGDVHINVASTLTIDACVVDRPVVNVAFDPVNPVVSKLVAEYYDFEHYRPVVRAGASALARDPAGLISAIARYLEDPSQDRAGRREIVALQAGQPDGRAAERVAAALTGML